MKQYRVILPKQDLLDSIVWFCYRSQEYEIESPKNMSDVLESDARRLLYDLYHSKQVISSDLEHYYHSMKFRVDHPDLCRESPDSVEANDTFKKSFKLARYYDFKTQKNKEFQHLDWNS